MNEILQVRTCLSCGSTYRIFRGMHRSGPGEAEDVLLVFPGNHDPDTRGMNYNRTSWDIIRCPICFSTLYHLEKGEEGLPALDYIHAIPTNVKDLRGGMPSGEGESES